MSGRSSTTSFPRKILPPAASSISRRCAPGEQQPDVEHRFRGENSNTGSLLGRRWRDAGQWFSYDLSIPHSAQSTTPPTTELRLTYFAGERDRRFDVVLDDRRPLYESQRDH